jgi:amino acid adenylation domain-containing protein
MKNNSFPLTLTQQDIYFDQLKHPDLPIYNVGGYICIETVDVDKINAAHQQVVEGYEAFGLRIDFKDYEVKQRISDQRDSQLPLVDLTSQENPQTAANQWMTQLLETTIDLHDAPLFKAYLLRLADNLYWYVGFAHHLAMDGIGFANWSLMLSRLYNGDQAANYGQSQWQSIVQADHDYLKHERYQNDKQYWHNQLKNVKPQRLAAHYNKKTVASKRFVIDIKEGLFERLKNQADSHKFSLAHSLLSVLGITIGHLVDGQSLVFGLPFHNRRNFAQKQMVGAFTSVSPLAMTLDPRASFIDLTRTIAGQQKENLRHQRYPVGHIIHELANGDADFTLYDVCYSYLKLDHRLEFENQRAHMVYLSNNHQTTPLALTVWEHGEQQKIELQFDYNFSYFNADEIKQLSERFIAVLEQVLAQPDRPLADIEPMTNNQLEALIEVGKGPLIKPLAEHHVHSLFEAQVAKSADAVAVSCKDTQLSYRQLNHKANQLAAKLRADGVKTGDLVGIYMDRDENLLVAVMAVLKAGGAYVPLDPAYPTDRIRYIIQDSGVQQVITQSHWHDKVTQAGAIAIMIEPVLEQNSETAQNINAAEIGLDADSLAYVIYTSGSTGLPKGVEVYHKNILALVNWAKQTYSAEEFSRVLGSTSLNFDLSVFEMFATLGLGYELVMVDNILSLVDQTVNVTLVNTVPSGIQVLLSAGKVPQSARLINLCGEPLSKEIINDALLLPNIEKVVNLYGPSEDTTYSTMAVFTEAQSETPTIGRCIDNSRAYVFCSAGKLVPRGAIGELYLAGDGVARGYRGQPQLTAERFVCDPFSDNVTDKMYRTGDLVRFLSDGQMAYIGRTDEMVKLKGYRIELGEIMHQLKASQWVELAAVLVAKEAGQSMLVAYVTLSDIEQQGRSHSQIKTDIKAQLTKKLADYMIPTLITILDTMPLTPNGKVDKQVLAGYKLQLERYSKPDGETELALAQLWSKLLELPCQEISRHANFFNLGGNSLKALNLMAKISKTFGVELGIKTISESLELCLLAKRIDNECALLHMLQAEQQAEILSEGCL